MSDFADQQGLSWSEAARRLKEFGPNELPSPERRSIARIAFEVMRQPMFALLLGGAVIYLLLGERLDAVVLALFATLSVSIGIVQEGRSEKVLQSLRNLANPAALVIREGKAERIAGRDLVPGDVILLGEGERVPADAILIAGEDFLADESLLTGESMPVRKRVSAQEPHWQPPGGEDQPFAFAGTLIVRGSGMARVTQTGTRSEMGKIGQSLRAITLEQPRLQKQLRWLVRDFALTGLAVAGLVVLLLGLSRSSWLEAGLSGIAVGMSVLPEEIPLVLTVFMAMGAWRISRAGVLTRRASAIETLGSATVLCTDKTGTLTENRMQVEMIACDGATWRPGQPLSSHAKAVLHAALGASAPVPTDPMDRATQEAAHRAGLSVTQHLQASYGLRPDLAAVTNLWRSADGALAAYAKGAPEAIAQLCRLDAEKIRLLLQEVDAFAEQGIRLLAVASARLDPDANFASPRDIHFRYSGLIGYADPLRATVPAAVAECRTAGIRVIMVTGDYPATARAIAARAGIDCRTVISGDALEAMGDVALDQAVATASIFARIRPQQKLRLVEALKKRGEIVAMTGDGVNDAPAMKAAHIGVAMGARGTDVAREASALVLLNDDFASTVATIRLGRRIYDNLRKAISYIVAVHIPIAGLALLPLFLGLPMMLMPIHIALLEMVIDPACSIVFEAEAEEADVMRRPPRPAAATLLPRRVALWAIFQGMVALAIVALSLLLGAHSGLAPDGLRAFVFTVLVLMNLGLILVNRSFRRPTLAWLVPQNRTFWILGGAVAVVLLVALWWPPARELFHFGRVHAAWLGAWAAAAALLIGALEFGKSKWGTQLPQ